MTILIIYLIIGNSSIISRRHELDIEQIIVSEDINVGLIFLSTYLSRYLFIEDYFINNSKSIP